MIEIIKAEDGWELYIDDRPIALIYNYQMAMTIHDFILRGLTAIQAIKGDNQ